MQKSTARAGAAEARADKTTVRSARVPWRDRPLTTLQAAAEISGLSTGTLYRFEKAGKLSFKRLGGRTLVDTQSLIELVDSAGDYAPLHHRTEPAIARRSEIARQAREQ